MAALAPTGYLTFVKICELTGGLLVMIPRFRNIGLLILGPIIVNIIANGVFIDYPKGLLNPMVPAVALLALFLLWTARAKFAALLN
jgi:putative oxidoreductase